MLRFAGVSGGPTAGRPQRTGPSLLEQLAAAETSDDEIPRDAAAPLPASRAAPPYAGFDQPDALLLGDNAEDVDDDDDEVGDEEHNERDGQRKVLTDAGDGSSAAMLQQQDHAEELFRGLEFLRSSGVEESSSVFQDQVTEFLEAAGDLFGRTAGRLPSDSAARERAVESDGSEDGYDDDGMGGGSGGSATAAAPSPQARARPPPSALTVRDPSAPKPPDGGADAGGDGDSEGEEEGEPESDPLYDPAADDKDARWVLENLQRLSSGGGGAGGASGSQPKSEAAAPAAGSTNADVSGTARGASAAPEATGAVLSCPSCFSVVCYDGRPHPRRADVFVAAAAVASSVFVDRTQALPPRKPAAVAGASQTRQDGVPGRSQRLVSWAAAGAAVSLVPEEASHAAALSGAPQEVTAAAVAVVWPPPAASGGAAAAATGPPCYAASCAHCGFGLGFWDDAAARFTFEYAIAGDG